MRRREHVLVLTVILLSVSTAVAQTKPVRACESLLSVDLPNTTIDSAAVVPADGTTPSWCRVTATVTHPPAGDEVKVFAGLPIENWNGRFQGTGGGGMMGGSERSLPGPVAEGYAAGSTDTGHEGGSGGFALDESGRLNWMLIRDNAYLGIHDMTVTLKALIRTFYGAAPRYSYFNGCSTGGRQGLSEAQRYPADYDGILSGAPAINFAQLHVSQLWGHLVMSEENNIVSQCKFEAANKAAVAACDALDGVEDGILEDPTRCGYDPKELVGTTPDGCEEVTAADAEVIRKIWEGPRRQDGSVLWFGLTRGAPFSGLNATRGTPLASQPNRITLDWFQYFLTQDPEWDWKTITPGSYEHFWDQSVEEYTAVIGTRNPDLTMFRDHGGKVIVWHGWSDPLIYPQGTIDYVERVQNAVGGPEETAGFLRLFMAPGVGHCGGGEGPQPAGAFDALRKWVEKGEAPETLRAVQNGNVERSRPLCQYPLVARYTGSGSTDDAANFVCEAPH